MDMVCGAVMERDRRAINHMDPETKAVHLRLESWGAWAREGGTTCAWPARTILGRLIEDGPSGAAQSGRPPVSMPEDIAAVDAAVAHLGDIDRKVVHTYYVGWLPIEAQARACHMRVRMFQNVLRRARWRVGGFLSARERSVCTRLQS